METAMEATVTAKSFYRRCGQESPHNSLEPALSPVSSHVKAQTERSRSDIAMFTMKKLIVFLMVCVL